MPTIKERMLSFGEIANMQDSLNAVINKQWRNIGHKESLTVHNFATELLVESVELIEDSGVEHAWWKQVKQDNFDSFNVKIEIIDMLHFFISQVILVETKRKQNKFSVPVLWDQLYMGVDVTEMFADGESDLDKLLNDGNKLNHEIFATMLHEMTGIFKFENPEVTDDIFYRYCYGLFHSFLSYPGISCQEMSAIYQAKMELNRFRQSKGYKTGNYKKVVDGVEDNQRLQSIVNEFMEDTSKTLAWVRKKTRDAFFQSTV